VQDYFAAATGRAASLVEAPASIAAQASERRCIGGMSAHQPPERLQPGVGCNSASPAPAMLRMRSARPPTASPSSTTAPLLARPMKLRCLAAQVWMGRSDRHHRGPIGAAQLRHPERSPLRRTTDARGGRTPGSCPFLSNFPSLEQLASSALSVSKQIHVVRDAWRCQWLIQRRASCKIAGARSGLVAGRYRAGIP
jgi:hypothetical protein